MNYIDKKMPYVAWYKEEKPNADVNFVVSSEEEDICWKSLTRELFFEYSLLELIWDNYRLGNFEQFCETYECFKNIEMAQQKLNSCVTQDDFEQEFLEDLLENCGEILEKTIDKEYIRYGVDYVKEDCECLDI